ncbi:MAG: hypothetical protein OFPII_08070 [Osedax symbiont Rs1]|nr:MAG: hypothetical protein OFPII_08070 [Osedax symbiont Rs1]
MRKVILAVSLSSVLLVTQSNAGDLYLGTSLGKSNFSLSGSEKAEFASDGVSITDKSATSYKLYTGYRFNPNFALEFSYANLGELKMNAGSIHGKTEANSVGVSALGIIPIYENLEFFGKLGVHRWDTKTKVLFDDFTETTSESGTNVHYGIGASYILNQIALRVEIERFKVDKANSTLVTTGISYRF